MYYNVTLRRVRATSVAVEKQQALHILSVCLQSACAIFSSVVCPAVQFSTLPHKQHDFQKRSY